MTRCLRIFGAYSYRLTRRHSTLTLMTAFVIILIVIVHLYHLKHRDPPRAALKLGDFEYRPGAFLRGRQPNANKSYCEFNYGLPDKLKWETVSIQSSPEVGRKGPYRVIYNAIQGTTFANHSRYDAVTYATQATPEFIYHISEIARYWDGPISLAVFVPNYDLDITIQIIKHLCKCYPGMAKVSLHLFYPKRHPPKIRIPEKLVTVTTEIPTTTTNITTQELLRRKLENYRNLDNRTRAKYIQWVRKRKVERMMMRLPKNPASAPILQFDDCSGLENFDIPTFRQQKNMIYPINVGRNVARNGSRTNYFIVSDIEMVPSDGLAPKFLTMVRKLMGDKKRDEGCIFAKTVFVVPLFEVERGEEIPHDKDTLVRMVAANRAMYFHQKVCSHCQRFPGLQTWLLRPSPKDVEPMLIARREYPYHRWEPLYFGTQKEPWYSEVLSWEGRQDKMTQMLELCLQGYKLAILDGGFLCHAATNRVQTRNSKIHRARLLNNYRYLKIIRSIKKKHVMNDSVTCNKLGSKNCYFNYGMLELCLQEYRMVVLDGAFLCHAAVPRNGSRHSRAERLNTQRYMSIIAALKKRYPDKPQCKVMWGCP